jgi:DNA cross-link repair 1C protein
VDFTSSIRKVYQINYSHRVAKTQDIPQDKKVDLQTLIAGSLHGNRQIPLHIDLDDLEDKGYDQVIGLKKIEEAVHEMVKLQDGSEAGMAPNKSKMGTGAHCKAASADLPQTITFPYSRHSSYQEQCDLLNKLRPRDVWPCTFDPGRWFCRGKATITIEDLFGQYCSGDKFRHDVEAKEKHGRQTTTEREDVEIIDSQVTTEPDQGSYMEPMSPSEMHDETQADDDNVLAYEFDEPSVTPGDRRGPAPKGFDYPYFYHNAASSYRAAQEDTEDSQATQISDFSRERRFAWHQAAVTNAIGNGEWVHIALESTTDNHTMPDVDLGSG